MTNLNDLIAETIVTFEKEECKSRMINGSLGTEVEEGTQINVPTMIFLEVGSRGSRIELEWRSNTMNLCYRRRIEGKLRSMLNSRDISVDCLETPKLGRISVS